MSVEDVMADRELQEVIERYRRFYYGEKGRREGEEKEVRRRPPRRRRSEEELEPMTPGQTANRTVWMQYMSKVADMARKQTELIFSLGEQARIGLMHWAMSRGIPLETLMERGVPVAQLVYDALEKMTKYDELAEYTALLEKELDLYRRKANPLLRLEDGLRFIMEFGLFLGIMRKLGFKKIYRAPIVKWYTSLLLRYMLGAPWWW